MMKKQITQKVRQSIARATKLLAEGKTMVEIASELGMTDHAIEDWRKRHRKLWNRDFRLAVQSTIATVRKNAGTDRVLANPDEYMRLAAVADRWNNEQHTELFPTSSVDLSLSGFYKAYYLPNCLGGTTEETRRQYEIILRLWQRITGDPPLRLITSTVVCKFRDTLLAMKGRGGHPYSVNTVRSKLIHVQAILDAAGPSGPRKRDAAGLLATVPYAKPPREELQIPRIVKSEWLNAVYVAAQLMNVPEGSGIPIALWWRALLSVALNTGLRRGSLFSLRWEYIDFERCQVLIPANRMKARRPHLIPLNADAIKHLQSIRGDGTTEMVFPWPYTRETFDIKFKLLQGLADIPAGERFGLHAIRRTAATLLWQNCPEAASIVLGHRSPLITLRHYVEPSAAATAGLNRLEQPWTTRTPVPDAATA
jgi:integrase